MINVTRLPICVLLLGLWVTLAGCPERGPIKIGYVGGVTGRVSGLGVAGRDGVLLAIEEQNRHGGIDGRRLELLVRDDQQDVETARKVTRELIDAGVVALIGPMTSSMAVALQPLINEAGIVMVSPTAKTDLLSGQDDFFFRVTAPLSRNAARIAEHAVGELGLKRFAVIYDENNRAFTRTWFDYFEASARNRGGEVAILEGFHSGPGVGFLDLANRAVAVEPEGILILANAIDCALLAQQVRKLGCTAQMFTSEWSFTADVLNFGGSAVEGMTSYHSFNASSQVPAYLDFKQKFIERFGGPPAFASVLAHDATRLLLAALQRDPEPAHLKQTLLEIREFNGLQSDFILDQYGDVERRLFLTTIKGGQFVVNNEP